MSRYACSACCLVLLMSTSQCLAAKCIPFHVPIVRTCTMKHPAATPERLAVCFPSQCVRASTDEMTSCADEDAQKLCETVCMVQYYPLDMKQNLTDCQACISQQPDAGYEQYDNVHAMLEVHIKRSSLIPEVMRLRWFPTTSDPIFADAGIQVMPVDSTASNLSLRSASHATYCTRPHLARRQSCTLSTGSLRP